MKPPEPTMKIEVQTKRIGKYRLKKIVSIVYEKYRDLEFGGWMVSILEGKGFVFGWGGTKQRAKEEFEKEFALAARTFRDIIIENHE